MKNKNIFVGTIKFCNDLESYKKYGEERFVGDFEICHTQIGSLKTYVQQVDDQAILIKIDEERFIWLKSLTSIIDEILIDFGLPIKVIETSPSMDNCLFIDRSSLRPYFDNNLENNKTSVHKLKRKILLDSRIKGGIEH